MKRSDQTSLLVVIVISILLMDAAILIPDRPIETDSLCRSRVDVATAVRRSPKTIAAAEVAR